MFEICGNCFATSRSGTSDGSSLLAIKLCCTFLRPCDCRRLCCCHDHSVGYWIQNKLSFSKFLLYFYGHIYKIWHKETCKSKIFINLLLMVCRFKLWCLEFRLSRRHRCETLRPAQWQTADLSFFLATTSRGQMFGPFWQLARPLEQQRAGSQPFRGPTMFCTQIQAKQHLVQEQNLKQGMSFLDCACSST